MGESRRRKQQAMAQAASAPTPQECTLPERVVAHAACGFEGCWRQVERVRADPGLLGQSHPWRPWCYIPVNAVVGIAAHLLRERASAGEVERAMTFETRLLTAAASWRMTKGVYVFDPDVLKALVDSEVEDELPDEPFLHLPEWCPYVATPGLEVLPGVTIHGFFAYVDDCSYGQPTQGPPELNFEILVDPAHSTCGECLFNTALADPHLCAEKWGHMQGRDFESAVFELARKREFLHLHTAVMLGEGSFLKAFTRDVEHRLAADGDELLRQAHEKTHEKTHDFINLFAGLQARLGSLLLYLVADRADIAPEGMGALRERVVANERRGVRNYPAEAIRRWEVGFRIGAQIRDYEQRELAGCGATGTGHTLRPHVRKAHWHSFWTGPRDHAEQRAKRVRWLPPIPVNVQTSDDLVPTVHKVEREPGH